MRAYSVTLPLANVSYNLWSLISAQIADLFMANSPYTKKTPKFVNFVMPYNPVNTGNFISIQDAKTGGEINNLPVGGSFSPPVMDAFDLTQCQLVGTGVGTKLDITFA